MWPFTPKKISKRFSKLVKLILSIDSHFEVTEDKEDSMRLHLPNYKGNQTMDFHIYLLEPFLYISFVTEVEGERISCLNNFHQNTYQQDMFNTAMANNLNKVRQVLNKEHAAPKVGIKEEQEKQSPQIDSSIADNDNTNDNSWGLRDYYDFDKSFKKHALTIMILRRGIEFRYFSSRDDISPMWSYVTNGKESLSGGCPSGTEPFVWIMSHYENREDFCWLLELLDEQIAHLWVESLKEPEELIKDIQKYVPNFKLGNDPHSVKTNLSWSWIDIHAILYFIDYCLKSENQSKSTNKVEKTLHKCTTLQDLVKLFYYEKNNNGTDFIKEKLKDFWEDEHGVIYSCDRKSIIFAPKNLKDYSIQQGTLIIENDAFKDCICLKRVFIPDSVTVICNSVFEGCINLKSVVLPPRVTYIGVGVFVNCKSLQSITIPKGIKSINTGTFSKCKSLNNVTINDDNRVIGDYAFLECESLSSITIPKSITSIGIRSFCYCSNLASIDIPDGVKTIGEEAFYGCEKLKSISIPNSVTTIGKSIFEGCSELDSIIIPIGTERKFEELIPKHIGKFVVKDSIQNNSTIEESNIINCWTMKEFFMDNGRKLQRVPCANRETGDNFAMLAFGEKIVGFSKGLGELTNQEINTLKNDLMVVQLIVDETVAQARREAGQQEETYRLCKKSAYLEEVYLTLKKKREESVLNLTTKVTEEDKANNWVDEYGVEYSSDKKQLKYAPANIIDYTVKDGTEIICDNAFANVEFEDVDYQTIVENGENMWDYAKFISKLNIIRIPNSVILINKSAFDYCTNLSHIIVPKGSLQKFINMLPMYESIIVEEAVDNENYYKTSWKDEYDVKYSVDKRDLLKVPKDIVKYTIIEGTITIGNAAFSNCNNLKSVIIANSITEIGHYAFANCNSLYLFAIPQNVRKLGSGAFMGCSELTSILLPSSIVFESDTFEGCEKLASVFVPQGEKYKYEGLLGNHDIDIKEYDPNDEEEMRMLNSIYHGILDERGVLYNYDEEILLSVTKPLEEYCVREGTIGIRIEAFKPDTMGIDRKSLKRLHLPDSLFMICNSAFVYNEGLEYINIPKNAKFLQDSNPFAGCFNLHRIKWETDNAVKEGTLIFNKERTTLIACLPWQYTEGNTILEQESHVILPDGLETIAANTFYHDEKLQEISLPASIKEIGKDVFIGCSSLKSIYIPEGTLHKFEKMLPEWADILKEQYKEVEDTLSEYELPDGSIYNGRCIRKPFGTIELNGLGCISYTNGDKYKGNFKYGRPYGWGIYFFKNGHKHKGYFNDTPNGIGYLNEDYNMAVGNFTNGRLNGWAICYRNRIFKFGYWREGRLITDYTTKTLWIRYEISNQRIEYKGNLIQMDEEHNFIRFGIPEKPLVNTYGNGIKNIWSLKEFFKAHGRMKIANMVNKNTQEHYKCLAFENPTTGVLCFVSFSNGLGELSGAEINTMKNELVVCELNVEPEVAARRAKEGRQIESYSLCKMSAIPALQIPLSRIPKMPAYGFEFYKDGTVKVGIVRNHDSGEYMLCKIDGTVECGKWKENIKTNNNSSFDLDNPDNLYEENGIDVYKKN